MAVWAPPTANQGLWTPGVYVGVSGGIDQYREGGANERVTLIDVTQAPYNADNTGATDVTAIINQAIVDAAGGAGDVVYLPAGDYRTDSIVAFYQNSNNITLRGDGPGITRIMTRAQTGVLIGQGTDVTYNSQTISGTKTKGTDALTVSDSSEYAAGQIAMLFVENELDNTRITAGAAPSLFLDGTPEARRHIVKVISVLPGQITIDPPLLYDCTDYEVRICNQGPLKAYTVEKVGVEDLTINGINGAENFVTNGVRLYHTTECWVYNVESIKNDNYPANVDSCYKTEIRHCTLGDRKNEFSSNGACLLNNNSTSGLLEDNIFKSNNPLIEQNFGSINNAWLYNIGCELVAITFDTNHGPHNLLNLFEGNIGPAYHADGYFGSVSHDTMFRNWWHGSSDDGTTALGYTAAQNRFTRNYVNCGNIFGWDDLQAEANSFAGNPNLGNADGDGTAQPTLGDFWRDWKLTGTVISRVSDEECVIAMDGTVGGLFDGIGAGFYAPNGPFIYWNSGDNFRGRTAVSDISGLNVTFTNVGFAIGDAFPIVGTAVSVWSNQPAWQEFDLDVNASNVMVHNYHAANPGPGAVENVTADTLPKSLAYGETQPDWWTDGLYWPPVEPNSPTFSITITPAGQRWLDSIAPPGSPSISITAPANHASYISTDLIHFTGEADDQNDGDISADIVWSSDLDGELGTGASIFSLLNPGNHEITASVTDSDENTATAVISLVVNPAPKKRDFWLRSRTLLRR